MDGITFDSNGQKSIEPIAVVNLFLPKEHRTKSRFTMLSGITPVNAKNVKVFLQPLLEEFAATSSVYDVLDDQYHDFRPIMIFSVTLI